MLLDFPGTRGGVDDERRVADGSGELHREAVLAHGEHVHRRVVQAAEPGVVTVLNAKERAEVRQMLGETRFDEVKFNQVARGAFKLAYLKEISPTSRKARNELNRKLSELADRRASLQALTYQPEEGK